MSERRSGLERRIYKRESQRAIAPMHEVATEIGGRRLRFWDADREDYVCHDRRAITSQEKDDGVVHRDPETCPCGTVVSGPVEERSRFADGSVWCGTCDGVRYDD